MVLAVFRKSFHFDALRNALDYSSFRFAVLEISSTDCFTRCPTPIFFELPRASDINLLH